MFLCWKDSSSGHVIIEWVYGHLNDIIRRAVTPPPTWVDTVSGSLSPSRKQVHDSNTWEMAHNDMRTGIRPWWTPQQNVFSLIISQLLHWIRIFNYVYILFPFLWQPLILSKCLHDLISKYYLSLSPGLPSWSHHRCDDFCTHLVSFHRIISYSVASKCKCRSLGLTWS